MTNYTTCILDKRHVVAKRTTRGKKALYCIFSLYMYDGKAVPIPMPRGKRITGMYMYYTDVLERLKKILS